jgi:hypothetical protein
VPDVGGRKLSSGDNLRHLMSFTVQRRQTVGRYMLAKVLGVQVQLMLLPAVIAESTSTELLMAMFAPGPLNATVI